MFVFLSLFKTEFSRVNANNVRSSGFPKKIFSSSFSQFPVKFQLKSEQGWTFFMQKLQLNSGQELCTVNMIWNSSIKSSNFTVNKEKYKDRIMFHTESYNFTVDKTI